MWKDISEETTLEEPAKATTTETPRIDDQTEPEIQSTEPTTNVLPTPNLMTEKTPGKEILTEKTPEKEIPTEKPAKKKVSTEKVKLSALEEAKMIFRFLQNKINFLEEKQR